MCGWITQWDGDATINTLCPVGDYSSQSRLTTVPGDMCKKVFTKKSAQQQWRTELREKERLLTSKSVAHAEISREGQNQSQSRGSLPMAVDPRTRRHLYLVDLPFPIPRHLGSRTGRLMWPMAIARTWLFWCALHDHWEWELQMRDRVFLRLLVAVIAILFSSVLTAHALFYMNELWIRVLMLKSPPPPDLTFSPFVTFLDLGKDKGEKNIVW